VGRKKRNTAGLQATLNSVLGSKIEVDSNIGIFDNRQVLSFIGRNEIVKEQSPDQNKRDGDLK
jgi:hypothetical protein